MLALATPETKRTAIICCRPATISASVSQVPWGLIDRVQLHVPAVAFRDAVVCEFELT